jgi:intracellular sulfur oxidation DsrE/DsrF family protein
MKKIVQLLFVVTGLFFFKPVHAQNFEGAPATQAHYKAIYFLDDSVTNKIQHTLKNIDNALEDARLKGKLEIELVVFGDGYVLYDKTKPYEQQLLALQKKGVILAMCNNTIKARHIDKTTLFPFIGYVPSGNGEIIIRGADGWVVVHP